MQTIEKLNNNGNKKTEIKYQESKNKKKDYETTNNLLNNQNYIIGKSGKYGFLAEYYIKNIKELFLLKKTKLGYIIMFISIYSLFYFIWNHIFISIFIFIFLLIYKKMKEEKAFRIKTIYNILGIAVLLSGLFIYFKVIGDTKEINKIIGIRIFMGFFWFFIFIIWLLGKFYKQIIKFILYFSKVPLQLIIQSPDFKNFKIIKDIS